MLKLPELRQHLTAAVPELARDPERLIVMASGGRIISTATPALSFEYAYTAQIFVLDFSTHADAIIVPLLAWAKRHQHELFANPERQRQGIRFNAEYLNTSSIDLAIEIDLTERVLVRERADGPPGALLAEHVPEPLPIGWIDRPEHWSLWLRDQLLAEWDFDPRHPPPAGTP